MARAKALPGPSGTVDTFSNALCRAGEDTIILPFALDQYETRRMMKLLVFAVLLALAACCAAEAGSWQVVDARWRPDANPFASEQVWESTIWTEGWGEPEQYYPKYLKPSGSVHVILKNAGSAPDSVRLVKVDGRPLAEAATTPQKAGPVVWYWVESPQLAEWPDTFDEQKSVPPGQWVQCSVRLRSPVKDRLVLTFTDGAGQTIDVPVAGDAPAFRIESVSFSAAIDRIYVYIKALGASGPVFKGLSLDGADLSKRTYWAAGPDGSGLWLAEVRLNKPLDYGTHHLLEVRLAGTRLVQPIRAWDNYFGIGLFGTVTREKVRAAKERGINTYYGGRNDILNEFEMNTIPHGSGGGERQRTPGGWGLLYWYNTDEPDAHDWHEGQDLPLHDRLGVLANLKVLPIQRSQRRANPAGLNMTLVNNTFKPANYYCYGQIPDVLCTDPYVPLGGRQVDYVWHALECARDASTPRPLAAVLWACSLKGDRKFGSNPPTPQEERMMVFYALGCGVKGYSYFIDLTQQTGEGQFTGVSDYPELWEEVGRTNRDAAALAPYLSIGCPAGEPVTQGWVWTRTLMCGPDAVVLVAVNTRHHIGFETKGEVSINVPVRNAAVEAALPSGFADCTVSEARNGELVPVSAVVRNNRVRLQLDEIADARAFLIRRKPDAPGTAPAGKIPEMRDH